MADPVALLDPAVFAQNQEKIGELIKRKLQFFELIGPIDLTTAITRLRFPAFGNYLTVVDATDAAVSVTVRLNDSPPGAPGFILKTGVELSTPFETVEISASAQAGKTVTLGIGKIDERFFKFFNNQASDIAVLSRVGAVDDLTQIPSGFTQKGGAGASATGDATLSVTIYTCPAGKSAKITAAGFDGTVNAAGAELALQVFTSGGVLRLYLLTFVGHAAADRTTEFLNFLPPVILTAGETVRVVKNNVASTVSGNIIVTEQN